MAINKIIYGGNTLIDLTGDTVTASDILTGKTAHDKSGAVITGTCDYDSNTTDATATASEILSGKTAYVNKSKITGNMKNNGAYSSTINTKAGTVTIPMGYHDGSGKVSIDETEQAKIIPGNILMGVEILGVTGTCEPSTAATAQSKTVTPTTTDQTILPDEEIDYLSQVVVKKIPYVESTNTAGGTTVTIAG